MHQLTREVRFAVNATPDDQLSQPPTNSYGGYPSLTGLGYFFTLSATVRGPLDPRSGYLLNIRQIDARLRAVAIPLITRHVRDNTFGGGGQIMPELFDALGTGPGFDAGASGTESGMNPSAEPGHPILHQLTLRLSPFQAWSILASESPMIRLSQMFEFAATHRLHNPALTDQENRATFGKCNNPHGHGHNYQLQVTLAGTPDTDGILINIPDLERIVAEAVIEPFDHKNLNVELPEFADQIPSVENIARAIHQRLKPRLTFPHARLAAVTVWETPKTWCEYAED